MGTRLAVYCGSNSGNGPEHRETAEALGRELAARGLGVVYGGGDVGLMGAVADAALASGGEVVGVIPEHLVRAEVAHLTLTELHIVDSMHARKALMADLVVGFIILPGGFGTLDEALEVLTWNQLGLIAKPVVFLDPLGFYEPLFTMFDRGVEAGFLRPAHRGLAHQARTIDDAIELALSTPPVLAHKWLDRDAR
jgi:uncharacterized protein (TIGR00730 family)